MEHTVSRELIREALDEVQDIYQEADEVIRANYSGRGMYGKECLGMVFDSDSHFFLFMVEFTRLYYTDWERKYDLHDWEPRDIFDDVRTDNMGYSTIYYMPSVNIADEAPRDIDGEEG